jgi:hypothetical protein
VVAHIVVARIERELLRHDLFAPTNQVSADVRPPTVELAGEVVEEVLATAELQRFQAFVGEGDIGLAIESEPSLYVAVLPPCPNSVPSTSIKPAPASRESVSFCNQPLGG